MGELAKKLVELGYCRSARVVNRFNPKIARPDAEIEIEGGRSHLSRREAERVIRKLMAA